MIRNLLFYCYPIKDRMIWLWHIDQLLRRQHLFNGRRILVLALDGRTEEEEVVRERFRGLDAEILIRKNNPRLGETAHFTEALGLLESLRDDEATFYAHAKGVTRQGAMLDAVLEWSDLLYRANLDFPDLVDRKLAEFPTVGCLRWRLEPPRQGWCFAGTFFWMRHSALFKRDWKKIDHKSFYGVEDYPGKQFKRDESWCLTREQVHPEKLYQGVINEAFIREELENLSTETNAKKEPV